MPDLLDKDTFDRVMAEHQKYLDSKFSGLETCINSVKGAREKAWEKHAEECSTCRACQDKQINKLKKTMVAGFVLAALLGAALSEYIAIQHVVGFIIKALTGHHPLGL